MSSPVSGSYRGKGIELRVDVDPTSQYSSVLHMISGDFWDSEHTSDEADAKYIESFYVSAPHVFIKPDHSYTIEGTGKFFQGSPSSGLMFPLKLEGKLSDGKEGKRWEVNISLWKETGVETKFHAVRYSSHFRIVELEVDFDSGLGITIPSGADEKNLKDAILHLLPSFDTKTHPTKPDDLPDRVHDLFSVYNDAGIQVLLDYKASDPVSDPNAEDPWYETELEQAMTEHHNHYVKPGKWKVWAFLAKTFREERTTGLMFDDKKRLGFAIFRGHPWFAAIAKQEKDNKEETKFTPEQLAIAQRLYLHTWVHEFGHALNLQHVWETRRTDSVSWMNYDWSYNQRHGPDQYFRRFHYTFDEEELVFLRHAQRPWVKPGEGNWAATLGPQSSIVRTLPPDNDNTNRGAKKIEFLARAKPSYLQGEVVAVELRLRNTHRARIGLDLHLGLGGGNIRVFVQQPSGQVVEVESSVHHIRGPEMGYLEAQGSPDGKDRRSEEIPLFYGGEGVMPDSQGQFYFREPGRYTIKAVYSGGGEYRLVSNTLNITVHELVLANGKGPELLQKIFDPLVGRYVGLGGSFHERFQPVHETYDAVMDVATELKGEGPEVVALYNIVLSHLSSTLRFNSDRSFVVNKESKKLGCHAGALDTERTDSFFEYYGVLRSYLHREGTDQQNICYAKIVAQRARQFVEKKDLKTAEEEVKELLVDLGHRRVPAPVLQRIQQRWEDLRDGKKHVPRVETKEGKSIWQVRLEEIVSSRLNVEEDPEEAEKFKNSSLRGRLIIRLSEPFAFFNKHHQKVAAQVLQQLQDKASETESIDAVLDFAEDLIKSGKQNRGAVQHALELFVIRHPMAKKAHMTFPQLSRPAHTGLLAAAISPPVPGHPSESDMDYWRNDERFQWHHRHWHTTYSYSNRGDHMLRRGELFVYMHLNMLGRYNADRLSWGLEPVTAYKLREGEKPGWYHSPEFHKRYPEWPPRKPNQRFEDQEIEDYEAVLKNLEEDFAKGSYVTSSGDRPPLDANIMGHLVEGSPPWSVKRKNFDNNAFKLDRYYQDGQAGIHNNGHGYISEFGGPMGSFDSARDPVFYRWHTFIDDLFQKYLATQNVELTSEPVPVRIDAIIIREYERSALGASVPLPPQNYGDYKGDWTVPATDFASDQLHTTITPPVSEFEFGETKHKPFAYHIRLTRTDGKTNKQAFTARIFMAPESKVDQRKFWFEMDKFRFDWPEGKDHYVISRKDTWSSVIRRDHDIEKELPAADGKKVDGFCECGWPYDCLLPRGTPEGQGFKILMFVSDNQKDTLGSCTKCGSLSFCGSKNLPYPDQKAMGYPINYPLTYDGKSVTLQQAAKLVPNLAFSDPITILNRDTRFGGPDWDEKDSKGVPDTVRVIEPALTSALAKDAVPAYLAQDVPGIPVRQYMESSWTGSFRVLIPGKYILRNGSKVQVALAGPPVRSTRETYQLTHISLQARLNQTVKVTGPATPVTFGGKNEVVVGQGGAVSDYVNYDLKRGQDVFLTFFAATPPTYLQRVDDPPIEPLALSWILGKQDITAKDDWTDTKGIEGTVISRPSIYSLVALYVQSTGEEKSSTSSLSPPTTITSTTSSSSSSTSTTTSTSLSPTSALPVRPTPPPSETRDKTIASTKTTTGDVQHRASPPKHEKTWLEKFQEFFGW